jgi:glycosyltransferase involved in cell wall biosynthesis
MSRPPLRLTYLAHSEAAGPTSRYRIYQFQEPLARRGIEVRILPAFGNAYFAAERHSGLPRQARRAKQVLIALLRRTRQMLALHDADGIVIERELFPYLPPVGEGFLSLLRRPYVLELDDAIYVSPERAYKYPHIVRWARGVIAGNEVLRHYLSAHNARVEVIPTVIDPRRYRPKDVYRASTPPRIGWIGLASNFHHLQLVAEELRQACSKSGARLVIVSARPPELDVPFEFVPWSEATEADVIRGFDVGIMPLVDSEFSRGKCGLKVLQYMAAGTPVVASPVGVNRSIVEHGHNGLLASSGAEWTEALTAVLGDTELRERLGRAARLTVEQHYALEPWADRLAAFYQRVFT